MYWAHGALTGCEQCWYSVFCKTGQLTFEVKQYYFQVKYYWSELKHAALGLHLVTLNDDENARPYILIPQS